MYLVQYTYQKQISTYVGTCSMSSMPSNNLYNDHRHVLMYFLSKYSYIEWLSCFLFLARCFQRRFLEGDTVLRSATDGLHLMNFEQGAKHLLAPIKGRQPPGPPPCPPDATLNKGSSSSSLALSDVSPVWRSTIGATYFSYLVVYRECGERGANSVLLALGEPTVK